MICSLKLDQLWIYFPDNDACARHTTQKNTKKPKT